MNYETIDYAYLSGILHSELVALAYDDKFPKNDFTARREYIDKIYENAKKKAIEFEKQVKAA
jgi:hypothetical protein